MVGSRKVVFQRETAGLPVGKRQKERDSISPFVMTLAHGGGDFYDGWMKNPKGWLIRSREEEILMMLAPGAKQGANSLLR